MVRIILLLEQAIRLLNSFQCGITELQELALKDITAKLSSKNILAELFSTFTSW